MTTRQEDRMGYRAKISREMKYRERSLREEILSKTTDYETFRGKVVGVYTLSSEAGKMYRDRNLHDIATTSTPMISIAVKTRTGDKMCIVEGSAKDLACLGALCEAAIKEDDVITVVGNPRTYDWTDSYSPAYMRMRGTEMIPRTYEGDFLTKKVGPEHTLGKLEEM